MNIIHGHRRQLILTLIWQLAGLWTDVRHCRDVTAINL